MAMLLMILQKKKKNKTDEERKMRNQMGKNEKKIWNISRFVPILSDVPEGTI
jgi:very-short-patch-repair endonuclease